MLPKEEAKHVRERSSSRCGRRKCGADPRVGTAQRTRPPQMAPSRADARSGVADDVTGYRGSSSKQEKKRGGFLAITVSEQSKLT
ncbi:hypothetical protein SFRURICE_016811 [Spodoptera frugiperda]|nr:hypothetical protein SFRURICE_016811 [Spodoptera frugiperda]